MYTTLRLTTSHPFNNYQYHKFCCVSTITTNTFTLKLPYNLRLSPISLSPPIIILFTASYQLSPHSIYTSRLPNPSCERSHFWSNTYMFNIKSKLPLAIPEQVLNSLKDILEKFFIIQTSKKRNSHGCKYITDFLKLIEGFGCLLWTLSYLEFTLEQVLIINFNYALYKVGEKYELSQVWIKILWKYIRNYNAFTIFLNIKR